jgi:hypothetical protein
MSKQIPKQVAERLKAAGWTDEDIARTWGTGDVNDVTDEQMREAVDKVAAQIPLTGKAVRGDGNQA